MAKKKAVVPVQKALPALTGEAARERAVREADFVWTRAQEEASRNYDQAVHGAWSRYIGAMKAHQDINGKKAKTGGTEFDKKFDQERENALRTWNLAVTAADKIRDAIDAET